MDMKLELVMVPVTDVDRAKEFYEKVGFVVDHDQVVSDDVRFVQLTPPGSACSIAIGKGLTQLEPGSLDNMQMRDRRRRRDPRRAASSAASRSARSTSWQWGRFVFFADPDGNGWALQELPDWSQEPAARAEPRSREPRVVAAVHSGRGAGERDAGRSAR